MGEKARRHGSGIAGGRSCRPARRSPEGRCRGEVRGAAYMGEKARHGNGLAEAAPASPQGTARRGSAGMGGEARKNGSGFAEAAPASPQGTVRRGRRGRGARRGVADVYGRGEARRRNDPPGDSADIMRRTKQKSGALSPCRQKNRKKRPAQADCLCGSALWDEREEYISSFIPFS